MFNTLSKAEMTAINNAQSPDATYGDVLEAIVTAERKHTLQQVVEWGDGVCNRHNLEGNRMLRSACWECWEGLRKEVSNG